MPPTPRPSLALDGMLTSQTKTVGQHCRDHDSAIQLLSPPSAPLIFLPTRPSSSSSLSMTQAPRCPTPMAARFTLALSRVANQGISYNRFHTTAMCSPTRASSYRPELPSRRKRTDRRTRE